MNIEQAVLENLRQLPSENQQEVLTFVRSLRQQLHARDSVQATLRVLLAEKILPNLNRIQSLHEGQPSAVYSNRLLRTMREMFDLAPREPLAKVLMVLHNAMAFQNRWIRYTAAQYQGAYDLFNTLADHWPLDDKAQAEQAIQTLTQLGFHPVPYEIPCSHDPDEDDED